MICASLRGRLLRRTTRWWPAPFLTGSRSMARLCSFRGTRTRWSKCAESRPTSYYLSLRQKQRIYTESRHCGVDMLSFGTTWARRSLMTMRLDFVMWLGSELGLYQQSNKLANQASHSRHEHYVQVAESDAEPCQALLSFLPHDPWCKACDPAEMAAPVAVFLKVRNCLLNKLQLAQRATIADSFMHWCSHCGMEITDAALS